MVPKFIQYLFNEDFLSDEIILEWYKGLPEKSSLATFKLLADLIEWIQKVDSSEEESN